MDRSEQLNHFSDSKGIDLYEQTVWTAMEHITAIISPCPMTTATQLISHGKWHQGKVLYNVSHIRSIV